MEHSLKKTMPHAVKALLASLIPGGGQLLNKQYGKGGLFFFFFCMYLFVFKDLFNIGLWGLFTLGTEVPRDNSIFLLAEGLIAIIVLGFGILFYGINLRDAYQNGKRIDQQFRVSLYQGELSSVISRRIPLSNE